MKIFALFLIALASAQALHINVTDVQNLALGFLVGSKAAEDVVDGQDCVNLITNEIPVVKQTIEDIKNLDNAKSFSDIVKVFNDLRNITSCKKTISEGKAWSHQIENQFESKENITKGLINLLKNEAQLSQDYESFKTNLNTKNMFLAGMNIGDMLSIYVFGTDTSDALLLNLSVVDTLKDVKDVIAGILVHAKAIQDEDSANQCVDKLDVDVKAFVDVVNKFKTGNAGEIAAGLKELFDTIMKSTDIVTKCKSVMTDGGDWFHKVSKRFTDKVEVAKGIWDLTSHLFSVTGDISTAVNDFRGHRNYYEAGSKIGDVMAIYCFGKTEMLTLLASVPATWTDCGLPDMKIKVSDVQLAATPAKGISDQINITGSMLDDEEFKYVEVLTTVNGGVLQKKNYDYTDIVSNGDDFNYEFKVSVPGFAPSGNYQVQFTHVNTSDEKVGCVRTTFTL